MPSTYEQRNKYSQPVSIRIPTSDYNEMRDWCTARGLSAPWMLRRLIACKAYQNFGEFPLAEDIRK